MEFYGTICGGLCWDELTRERIRDARALENYGYKVYSQNDEDGIIEEIFNRIGTTGKHFVEFGVQDGLECNSHFLLHRGWKGLWLEGSKKYCEVIKKKFRPVLRTKQLNICNTFITKDNINEIIKSYAAKLEGELDFLSIDIDGNDWYVWNAITDIQPRVVCIEYNGKFPPDYEWKQAYNENHIWDGSDWQGASLKAMEKLGEKKGYKLVGTNLNGINAFFVKKELISDSFLEAYTSEELYNPNRQNLKFYQGGHPAKYCLVGQEDNKGILNYYDSVKEYKKDIMRKRMEHLKWRNFKGRVVAMFRGKEL